MMETYSGDAIFSPVHHGTKIIDPIVSRCAKFRFKPLAEKQWRPDYSTSAPRRVEIDGDAFGVPKALWR